MMSKEPGRFQYYSPLEWRPGFWNMTGWPFFADDEYGRKIVVIGTFFTGYLVWAYKTCHCEDCEDLRLYTRLCDDYGEGFAGEVLHRRVRLREMQRE
jgi:hypothetical protein